MTLLFTLVFILLHIHICHGATTTPTPTALPAVLTGDCINATMTFVDYRTTYTPEFITSTPLIDGQWRVSIYSTSGASVGDYYYWTLGCQAGSLSCCPSEAISTSVQTYTYENITTTYFSVKPVTACPADYITLIDQGVQVDATHAFSIKPTTLCCPSGWKIWPTAFSKLGDTDTNPCYQPWPSSVQGETEYVPAVTDPVIPGSYTTLDYTRTPTVTDVGLGTPYTLGIALGIQLTRSYRLENASSGQDKLGPGKIVAIVIPITCLFIGVAMLYLVYRRREKRKAQKKKTEEEKKGPGMPELGEGLRHELEPGTKIAAPGTRGAGMPETKKKEDEKKGEKGPDRPELGEGLRHELEHGAKRDSPRTTGSGAAEADGNSLHELHNNAILQAPWSDGPLHEFPDRNLRELDSNVPAAHEVDAEDWRIVP
ncbi:hypothetical protein N431DRAFT_84335, partial [Stipitochalara longipes BDJ]